METAALPAQRHRERRVPRDVGLPGVREAHRGAGSAMSLDYDRRVHASHEGGWEVVRYDRAGKYYLEHPRERRQLLTLLQAVTQAGRPGWTVHLDLPGGQRFDHAYRKEHHDRN